MKKPASIIRQLHDWFLKLPQKFMDYYFVSDDDDEEYISTWSLDCDPWNLDYDPWNFDGNKPDWIGRFGDWLYSMFYGDDWNERM